VREELAKLYVKKSADTAAKAADNEAQKDAQQAEFQNRVEQGRIAMRDVVIPFFQELASTFPNGVFRFNASHTMDASLVPVAVSFKIGDGAEHVIEVVQGNVQIYYNAIANAIQRNGFNIVIVYAGNAEPFIAGPSDLTREKLCKLVEKAINKL
jgi:hypothetical protein